MGSSVASASPRRCQPHQSRVQRRKSLLPIDDGRVISGLALLVHYELGAPSGSREDLRNHGRAPVRRLIPQILPRHDAAGDFDSNRDGATIWTTALAKEERNTTAGKLRASCQKQLAAVPSIDVDSVDQGRREVLCKVVPTREKVEQWIPGVVPM